jgi:hypothetical protein
MVRKSWAAPKVRRSPGEAEVKRAPHAVDVGPRVSGTGIGRLLRCDGVRRAEHVALISAARDTCVPLGDAGQAEVDDLHGAAAVHKEIAGLEVAVNDAPLPDILTRLPHAVSRISYGPRLSKSAVWVSAFPMLRKKIP